MFTMKFDRKNCDKEAFLKRFDKDCRKAIEEQVECFQWVFDELKSKPIETIEIRIE